MAATAHLDIKIGDTFYSEAWPILIGGAPVDLTEGFTFRAQIRPRPDSAAILHEFTSHDIIVTPATPGPEPGTTIPSTVQLHIYDTDTAALGEWVAAWDLQISHDSMDRGLPWSETALAGTARTTWDVTR